MHISRFSRESIISQQRRRENTPDYLALTIDVPFSCLEHEWCLLPVRQSPDEMMPRWLTFSLARGSVIR